MNDQPPSPAMQRQAALRELAHDIRSSLGVVDMGLFALDAVRDDPAQFGDLYATVREDGLQQLKEQIEKLLELACEAE